MIDADTLWTICVAGIITLFGLCALTAISFPLAIITGRAINNGNHAAREQADAEWAELQRQTGDAS